MAAIVVIEDEPDLRELVRYHLDAAGHEVQATGRGADGLTLCRERLPDVVVLDLMLPDLQGTDVCRALRRDEATRSIAVIMLTAKGEEIDRVIGFELGADDYVSKPFSMRELVLRVAALLRRREDKVTGPTIVFGRLRLEREAHRVWVDGAEVALTAIELRLLALLHERRGRVQTRESLVEELWGHEDEVTPRAVDTHVKRLREKLSAAGGYIETVRGVGYRFVDSP